MQEPGQEQNGILVLNQKTPDKRKKRKKPEKPETIENDKTPADHPGKFKLEKVYSNVKRGLISPPCSSQVLKSWYDDYANALCGENSAMRFTVILDGVDLAFPKHESSFWAEWIPIVQKVVDTTCPRINSPFCGGFIVRYLERYEGGFEFVCKDKHFWKDFVFPDYKMGQQPDRVEIRIKGHQRIGSASLITFAAQENCPLVFMMGFLKCCLKIRVKVVEIENLPDWDDPIWITNSLFDSWLD